MPTLERIAIPDEAVTTSAAEAVPALAAYLREHREGWIALHVENGAQMRVTVPAEAFRLFVEVLDSLARGSAVTVAPIDTELTTQQAAELLNVSRPYLVKVLESGEIPFRRVGSHRRVRLVDVLEYQRRDDVRREDAFREFIREQDELGLFEDD